MALPRSEIGTPADTPPERRRSPRKPAQAEQCGCCTLSLEFLWFRTPSARRCVACHRRLAPGLQEIIQLDWRVPVMGTYFAWLL